MLRTIFPVFFLMNIQVDAIKTSGESKTKTILQIDVIWESFVHFIYSKHIGLSTRPLTKFFSQSFLLIFLKFIVPHFLLLSLKQNGLCFLCDNVRKL